MQRVLIDYFVCSWKISCYSEGLSIFRLFCLPEYDNPEGNFFGTSGFTRIPSYYGSDICYYRSGIKVHISDDLVILDCSGKGCRALEDLFDWDWERFFDILRYDLTFMPDPKSTPKAHISRLDVACDVLDQSDFTVPKIYNYVSHGKFICKSKRYLYGSGTDEEWLMFGSPKSDRRLRIYNKAMEQGGDSPWVRAEFQLRNDNALSFMLNYYSVRSVPECYYGVMHDYLRILKNVLTDVTMIAVS